MVRLSAVILLVVVVGPWSRASSPLLEDCLLSARIDREFQLIFSATRDKATNDTYIFLRIDMCMFD
jgi:hypothetical protein